MSVEVSSAVPGYRAGTQGWILEGPMSVQHKGQLSNTLSSLGMKAPWEMESFLKQEAHHPRLDGTSSAL